MTPTRPLSLTANLITKSRIYLRSIVTGKNWKNRRSNVWIICFTMTLLSFYFEDLRYQQPNVYSPYDVNWCIYHDFIYPKVKLPLCHGVVNDFFCSCPQCYQNLFSYCMNDKVICFLFAWEYMLLCKLIYIWFKQTLAMASFFRRNNLQSKIYRFEERNKNLGAAFNYLHLADMIIRITFIYILCCNFSNAKIFYV